MRASQLRQVPFSVRGRGLEPPRLATLAPQASLATNYSTRALSYFSTILSLFNLALLPEAVLRK